jgi:hypothetical protein
MITDTAGTVTVAGSLDATDTAEMSLDQDGMAHLMGVLTNLYGDKYLAVLREYSTNARDSHIEAGNPDPIRVTLPTALNPTLVISDNGVGLSRRQIIDVYAKYGASTKRGTNSQVGSFGLGAKSAFTIGSQFVVTAVKDEVRTVAVFALNEHGVGTVNILDERPAPGAENGVTVDIAVSDTHALRRAAQGFFYYWAPGTVLVDGVEPVSVWTDEDAPTARTWLGDDVLYTGTDGITVVMGSVGYRLPSSAAATVRRRVGASWDVWDGEPGLVVFVPIGSVDITPSREGIRDTDKSLTTIAAALNNMADRFADKLAVIAAEHDPAVAPVAYALAARPLLKLSRKLGVTMDAAAIRMPADMWLGDTLSFGLGERGGLSVSDRSVLITADNVGHYTVLVGVPAGRSPRRHARAWLEEDNHARYRTLLMIGDGAATEGSVGWFTWGGPHGVPVVHYDSIELPDPAERGTSRAVIYSVLRPGGSYTEPVTLADLRALAATTPVAWSERSYSARNLPEALTGHVLVMLSERQKASAFVRRMPTAVTADSLLKAWTAARLAALGDLDELTEALVWAEAISRVEYFMDEHTARLTHSAWTAARDKAATFRALSGEDKNVVRAHVATITDVRAAVETAKEQMNAALPLLGQIVDSGYRYNVPDAVFDALVDYVNTAPVN